MGMDDDGGNSVKDWEIFEELCKNMDKVKKLFVNEKSPSKANQ